MLSTQQKSRASVVHKDVKHAQKGVYVKDKRRQKLQCDFPIFCEKADKKHVCHCKHRRYTHKRKHKIFQREKSKDKQHRKQAQKHKKEH